MIYLFHDSVEHPKFSGESVDITINPLVYVYVYAIEAKLIQQVFNALEKSPCLKRTLTS